MKKILTKSEAFNQEYCATVVRIGEVTPIEGSDFLGKVIIEGQSVVVRKDAIKTGDVMIYAANETVLNHDFLRVNNEFELGERERNDNFEEVEAIIKQRDEKRGAIAKLRRDLNAEKKTIAKIEEGEKPEDHASEIEMHNKKIEDLMNAIAVYEKEESELEAAAKSKVGFFNKHGRVKMITLRKCPSFGYLIAIENLAKAFPEVKDVDWETLADGPVEERDFDTIGDTLFIKVYVPYVPPVNERATGEKKRNKKLKKFDRMIPGQFSFHYDTAPLNKNMHRIEPDDKVTISVKLHGTSFITANIKVRVPKQFHTGIAWLNNILNKAYAKYVPLKWQSYTEEYGNVYSSRTVIKNQFINQDVTGGYYKTDVWAEYNELLKDIIPQGMSIYGEIVGYISGAQTMIQKKFDYGCAEGTNKLMIYRINTENEDGTHLEWNVQDVYNWTMKLLNEHPELKDKIHPIDILYHGTLKELYPKLDVTEHWHENVLEELKDEKKFGMEELEPLCKIKVPREGIVIRIDDDPTNEAFKLKCTKFLQMESKNIDTGDVDIEMTEGYGDAAELEA
jgi:hypothetical protein